ncbi:MAG TPA: hypothetical protein VFT42_05240 [Solirubrobacteraceae bacterium]|nr:hypothetical protein [Solirubrobacteraceae bacterium]
MAVPLHEAVRYVAGAYAVVFVLVVLYTTLITRRIGRVERDVQAMEERLGR